MADEAREIRSPFQFVGPGDEADFSPRPMPAGDEADPKGSTALERADFSDTVPQMEPEESDLSGAAATKTATRVIMPPKVPSPGSPAS
jgi:hypothetical protein